jgi:hypothetical protein
MLGLHQYSWLQRKAILVTWLRFLVLGRFNTVDSSSLGQNSHRCHLKVHPRSPGMRYVQSVVLFLLMSCPEGQILFLSTLSTSVSSFGKSLRYGKVAFSPSLSVISVDTGQERLMLVSISRTKAIPGTISRVHEIHGISETQGPTIM